MHNNLVNINAIKIKFISLDSSYYDESNGIKFIKIQSVDFLKTRVCRIIKFEKIPLK